MSINKRNLENDSHKPIKKKFQNVKQKIVPSTQLNLVAIQTDQKNNSNKNSVNSSAEILNKPQIVEKTINLDEVASQSSKNE